MFTFVRGDSSESPVWYRNTYFQEKPLMKTYEPVTVADKQKRAGGTVYPARMAFGDGYKLVPLLTPSKYGPVLHKSNLARAMKPSGGKVYARDY